MTGYVGDPPRQLPDGLRWKLVRVIPPQYAEVGHSQTLGMYQFVSGQAPDGKFYHLVMARERFWFGPWAGTHAFPSDEPATDGTRIVKRMDFYDAALKAWGYVPEPREPDPEIDYNYCGCSYCEGH